MARQIPHPLSHGLIHDVAALSSGTLASLIGSARYDDIDAAHATFLLFVAQAPDTWRTWQEAWQAYAASGV